MDPFATNHHSQQGNPPEDAWDVSEFQHQVPPAQGAAKLILVAKQLKHPGLAKVLPVRLAHLTDPVILDWPLQSVTGVNLLQHCRDQNLDARQTIGLYLLACKAVEHLHSNHVIHGELSPPNILVQEDGKPTVVHFELALQRTFSQQAASVDGLNVQTDLKAMASILAELIDGPMRESMPKSQALRFTAILKHALGSEEGGGYTSMEEFSNDLRFFMRGEPTLAKPPSFLKRLWKQLVSRSVQHTQTQRAASW
ncbi:MAG: protein kinase [Planctomycetes bacterium]|nr:protein kinase [Planctomycetota bacterium]